VLEVREDALEEVTREVRRHMAAAADLKVPLRVDAGHGPHWDAAH
jgi:DNA polymerase-1